MHFEFGFGVVCGSAIRGVSIANIFAVQCVVLCDG